jgi:hypothetical protein
MKKISDEMIMAYVDGELEGAQAESVRQALAQDPELARRAEIFSESAAVLRVFDVPLDEEVPEQLLETVRTVPAGSWSSRLSARAGRLFAGLGPRPVPALAVVLILVLGGWLAYQGLHEPGVQGYPSFIAGQSLSHILETVPSGQEASADNRVTVMPVLTFAGENGTFCRRFDVRRAGEVLGSGIGCRTGPEKWKVLSYQGQEQEEGSPVRQGYELAGSEDSLDRFMEDHRQGPILSIQEERDLLQRRWKRM